MAYPHEFDVDGPYDKCFLIESRRVELDSELGGVAIRDNDMKHFQV
ncbi:MAG: hypothetical protein ACP5FT_04530 [Acidilobus sp.]